MVTYASDFSEICREKINDIGCITTTVNRFIIVEDIAYIVISYFIN